MGEIRRLKGWFAGSVVTIVAVLGCTPSTEDAGEASPAVEPAAAAGEMITFESGGESVAGYLVRPEEEPQAVVVVVQEWWGLNDWIKSVADRMADHGYLAVAPDLYRGQVATEPEEAHELARGLPEERAVRDVRSAAAHARSLIASDDARTAVVGFCMGGRLAILASLDESPFQATVVCYGKPETSPERLRTLGGSLLGIYGADDKGIGPDQVADLKRGLEEAGKDFEILVLENAGHAFMNSDRPNSFAPEATETAWKEIDAFLQETLAAR